jgi:hypothetical protein
MRFRSLLKATKEQLTSANWVFEICRGNIFLLHFTNSPNDVAPACEFPEDSIAGHWQVLQLHNETALYDMAKYNQLKGCG